MKRKAALTLIGLMLSLILVNTLVLPQIGYFFKLGDYDMMFQLGKQLGAFLADLLGNKIFELIGIVAFLA